ncbi:structural maintenance of chromosomes protein 2-like [Camellia sinensis]|uniref:structural maintenance of chromosomes protein 2-like n=1 Tax=Camellia sinensis TaxID=4442 RepID=UPI001035727D|nr:structural maintenance of chromosomes protein 2-like [Camellia sinensis]
MATSVSLSADKAAFRVEPDLVAIALAAQSALLTVERIVEMGRRHHDAIEQLDRLQTGVEGQRSRAEFEALRAKMEGAWAEAEMERARNTDELRLSTEKRADASKEALKLAQEAVSKLEPELEEVKKAKEAADLETSKAFEAEKSAAFAEYVDEVPKFENWGFKHGWLKALAAADVTLAMPIPYEQVDIELQESDSED